MCRCPAWASRGRHGPLSQLVLEHSPAFSPARIVQGLIDPTWLTAVMKTVVRSSHSHVFHLFTGFFLHTRALFVGLLCTPGSSGVAESTVPCWLGCMWSCGCHHCVPAGIIPVILCQRKRSMHHARRLQTAIMSCVLESDCHPSVLTHGHGVQIWWVQTDGGIVNLLAGLPFLSRPGCRLLDVQVLQQLHLAVPSTRPCAGSLAPAQSSDHLSWTTL
jgi:hypothetical protein